MKVSNRVYALQNKLESLNQAEASSQHKKADLEAQLQDNQDAIAGARASLESFNTQLETLLDRMQVVEASYTFAEQEYNFANASYNEINLQFTRQQSKLVALKQELEFKTNQFNDLQVQMANSGTQLEEASSHIGETSTKLQEVEAALLDMMQNKDAEERKLNDADQAYYNLRNELNEKESEVRHKSKEREQVDQLLNLIKDKVNELRLQLAGIKERLSVEFRVELDNIIDEPSQTDDTLEELQASCDRMKKRLENMGEVNPTAIEAFTEMKKRYDFIVEQKNDLVTAKDTLMQTIQEVEATANQKFLETFNQVRENFQKVFKALFTEEDTADMIMVDPENLADTAIDIIAKPKGKRPSSISQLSGERRPLLQQRCFLPFT